MQPIESQLFVNDQWETVSHRYSQFYRHWLIFKKFDGLIAFFFGFLLYLMLIKAHYIIIVIHYCAWSLQQSVGLIWFGG
jgi:hypothetical protein